MTPDPLDDLIEVPLLRYLQSKLQQPNLRYLKMPTRFAGGVENRVYGFHLQDAAEEFSKPLILRLFSQLGDANRVRREFTLQNALADLGFPSPRAFVCEEDIAILGGPFTIMERLPGTVAFTNAIGLSNALQMWFESSFRAPRRLAEVQASLHRLDAGVIARKMNDVAIAPATINSRLEEIQNRIEGSALKGLRGGIDWLFEHQPPNDLRLAVCHGDLWGGNLLSNGSKITGVLDWSMATIAPPEFDVAITSVGMRYGVPDMPGALRAFLRPIQYDASLRYLREYRRRRDVDDVRLQYFTAMRCVEVCSWVFERRLGIAGAIRDDSGPNVWDAPGSTVGFESFFRRYSGILLEMPPERIQFLY